MYCDSLEAAIADVVARLAALESAAPADTTDLQADVAALQTEVAELDARLDAIAAGAADPLS